MQSPEYPDLWWGGPSRWFTAGRTRAVQYAVIHATQGSEGLTSAEAGAAYNRVRDSRVSTHYFHDQDNTVQCILTTDTAWHARDHGNAVGIGYELCGRSEQTPAQWHDAASLGTLRNAAKQVARDCVKYRLPVRRLSVAEVRAAYYAPVAERPRGICFAVGTLILTRDGLRCIEEVRIGDEVWTHAQRWRSVTAVMEHEASILRLRGQGQPDLRTTAEHPIYSPPARRVYPGERARGMTGRHFGEPEWTAAGDMTGRYWLSPVLPWDMTTLPEVVTSELLSLAGRWAGDGCVVPTEGRVHISADLDEVEEVIALAQAAGFRASHSRSPAAQAAGLVGSVRISSRWLCDWLVAEFGRGAAGKRIPGWLLTAHDKYREAFMRGYLSADGSRCTVRGSEVLTWEASSVSKALALGVKLLAQSLGWSTAMYLERRAGLQVILGRSVSIRDRWRVRMSEQIPERARCAWTPWGLASRVHRIEPLGSAPQRVFNLSVDGDESYVADGIIVHNCGHVDVTAAYPEDSGTHWDPGPSFPWTEFLSMVQTEVDTMALADDRDFAILIWRVEALLHNRATVNGGPTAGERNELHDALAAAVGKITPNDLTAVSAAAEAGARIGVHQELDGATVTTTIDTAKPT